MLAIFFSLMQAQSHSIKLTFKQHIMLLRRHKYIYIHSIMCTYKLLSSCSKAAVRLLYDLNILIDEPKTLEKRINMNQCWKLEEGGLDGSTAREIEHSKPQRKLQEWIIQDKLCDRFGNSKNTVFIGQVGF